MPVRESDKREETQKELEMMLSVWDNHLKDQDWIERITENSDWKRLVELYEEEGKLQDVSLSELKDTLCTKPMAPDKAIALREAVMLMEQTRENRKAFVEFPQREIKRLEEIRRQYPKLKSQLDEIKKREEVLAHA